MKTWQKLMALLMALAMVFILGACDNGGDNASDGYDICGEWAMEIDLCDYLNEVFAKQFDDMAEVKSELPITLAFEFDEDGKYSFKTNVDKGDFNDYLDDLCDVLVDYLYDMAADNGMSESDFEDAIEAKYGMSLDAYAHKVMEDATSNAVDSLTNTNKGYYKIVGDTVYMDVDEDDLENVEDAEASMVISISGNKMTIKEMNGDGMEDAFESLEEVGMDLPWKLSKQ